MKKRVGLRRMSKLKTRIFEKYFGKIGKVALPSTIIKHVERPRGMYVGFVRFTATVGCQTHLPKRIMPRVLDTKCIAKSR